MDLLQLSLFTSMISTLWQSIFCCEVLDRYMTIFRLTVPDERGSQVGRVDCNKHFSLPISLFDAYMAGRTYLPEQWR